MILIIQFSTLFCYILPLKLKHLPQHPILDRKWYEELPFFALFPDLIKSTVFLKIPWLRPIVEKIASNISADSVLTAKKTHSPMENPWSYFVIVIRNQ